MKVAALVAGLAVSALARPFVDLDLDSNSTLADAQHHQNLRRQGNVIVTTGTQGTPRANRIEIRTMQSTQPQQFALLNLALIQWKAASQTADDSYWGIAKIHGVPRQDWNGVKQCSTCTGPNVDGYCSHSVMTFPMWHRAYLGLFEQEFLAIAKSIADNAQSNRAQWQQVAASLRWPYFDWAAAPPSGSPNTVPSIVTDLTVTVDGPNGRQTLYNPFYTFQFADPSKNVYQYFTEFPQTLRYPTSNNPDASSNEQAMIDTFNQQRTTIRDQLYTLLTGCDNYQQFATITGGGQGACYGSIEGLHDTVHNNFGSLGGNGVTGGHMTYLPESSYDPVFWLHHANVDRLIALWQAMHTDFSASQTTSDASWAVGPNTQIDMNFPLYPFRKDYGSFWSSNDLKDHRIFNADYPEFTTTDGSAASIRAIVDRLYGPNASGTAGDISKRQLPAVGDAVKELTNSIGEILSTPFAAKNGSSFEYFANIETPRYGGDGSYQIIAFHKGPSNEDPSTWGYDPNLVGAYGVFAAPGRTAMKAIAQGQIPLATYLRDMVSKGQLKDLSEAEAVPFLQKNLRMRIQGWKGVSLKPEQIPGFKAEILSSTRQPEQNILKNLAAEVANVFSEFIPLPQLTENLFQGA